MYDAIPSIGLHLNHTIDQARFDRQLFVKFLGNDAKFFSWKQLPEKSLRVILRKVFEQLIDGRSHIHAPNLVFMILPCKLGFDHRGAGFHPAD